MGFSNSRDRVGCYLIYIFNHILLKNQHIVKQKNMKILLLFLPKNPDKLDIFKKSHLSRVRLSGTPAKWDVFLSYF